MVIVGVEDGLLVRASRAGSRHPELLEFVDGQAVPDGGEMNSANVRRRLFPGGYAPFLEALGERLDQRAAVSISIVEGTDFVTVGGFSPVLIADDEIMYEALDILLLADDIIQLISQDRNTRAIGSSGLQTRPVPEAGLKGSGARHDHRTAGKLAAATATAFRMIDAIRPQTSRARG